MTVKRNSRTAECPVDSQGTNAAREFRRNIEHIKAEKSERQRDSLTGETDKNVIEKVLCCISL